MNCIEPRLQDILTPLQFKLLQSILYLYEQPLSRDKFENLVELIKNYDTIRDDLIKQYQEQAIQYLRLGIK